MKEQIIPRLIEAGIAYRTELSLKDACTFRVGGIGALGIYPKREEELIAAVAILEQEKMDHRILGKGSNLFFGDGRYEGALIVTEGMEQISVEGDTMTAGAGATLASMAVTAARHSLAGLAFARGIPGTLGGAMFMNAGAYGSSMDAVVVSSRALNRTTGEVEEITDHRFGYRKSIYMECPELICLSAVLKLWPGEREAIESDMRELAAKRRASQPLEYPSGGSYFKRPEGHFAGKLIEDAGLKGFSVGGAAVSEKHAGFVINRGGATAADLLALEAEVRRRVEERFGVSLVREVRYFETD